MAVLKMKDIKKLGEKELSEKLNELKLELAKERANIAIGATVTSPGRIKEIRRGIARIETEKTERKAGAPAQEKRAKGPAPSGSPDNRSKEARGKPAASGSEPKGVKKKQ